MTIHPCDAIEGVDVNRLVAGKRSDIGEFRISARTVYCTRSVRNDKKSHRKALTPSSLAGFALWCVGGHYEFKSDGHVRVMTTPCTRDEVGVEIR